MEAFIMENIQLEKKNNQKEAGPFAGLMEPAINERMINHKTDK